MAGELSRKARQRPSCAIRSRTLARRWPSSRSAAASRCRYSSRMEIVPTPDETEPELVRIAAAPPAVQPTQTPAVYPRAEWGYVDLLLVIMVFLVSMIAAT